MSQEEKWNDGWPRKEGYYTCLVDGEVVMRLKYYVCQVARKPHWVDDHGEYFETQYKIKWRED